MIITKKQLLRTKRDFSEIAKEEVSIKFIKGAIYCFCSEVGTLRLLKKYRDNQKANTGYSENLKNFYFVLEIPGFESCEVKEV